MHNLTLRNIARLNVALGSKVIIVPPADAQPAFIFTSPCLAKPNDPYSVKPGTPHKYVITGTEEAPKAA